MDVMQLKRFVFGSDAVRAADQPDDLKWSIARRQLGYGSTTW